MIAIDEPTTPNSNQLYIQQAFCERCDVTDVRIGAVFVQECRPIAFIIQGTKGEESCTYEMLVTIHSQIKWQQTNSDQIPKQQNSINNDETQLNIILKKIMIRIRIHHNV